MGIFDFLKKTPTLNEIQGSFGEWLAKIFATTLPGALVLNDVLIDGADGFTSQMDLLLIGNRGVYVVEVKMYPDAKIYGNTRQSKWYYYSHGHKYDIYSPMKQNQKHIDYLKRFLSDFGDVPCFSVVTMVCDDFKISGDYPPNTVLCNSLPGMEKGIYKVAENKPIVWDDAQKQAVFEHIKQYQITEKDARIKHKENVIAYQKAKAEMQEQKICPYCKTELILRKGKNGEFYGCKNYPKCRYTQSK